MRLPSPLRRHAAVLLVLAGSGLLGAGASGLGGLDGRLEAAALPAAPPARVYDAERDRRVALRWHGDRAGRP